MSVCWRSLGVPPQMDPWGCVPVSASLGASDLWGHLPVCRGVVAGAGPGRAHPEGRPGAGPTGSYLAPGPRAARHPADRTAGGGHQKGRPEWGDEGS